MARFRADAKRDVRWMQLYTETAQEASEFSHVE